MELTIDQEVIEEGIVWFYKSLYLEDELRKLYKRVLFGSIRVFTWKISSFALIWMCGIFPGFLRIRVASLNNLLRKLRFLGWSWILMEIKLLDLMVSLWLFSTLVGPLSKLIFWTFFSIFLIMLSLRKV